MQEGSSDCSCALDLIMSDTKYDRQLRLWAQDGQSRLEKSHVCLINAQPVGVEALKNLVLPGIGDFTILDSRIVQATDLEGNFFLNETHLHRNIAECLCESLSEMNPDSRGHVVLASIEEVALDANFWEQYDIVILDEPKMTQHTSSIKRIQETLWKLAIPLLRVSTSGFFGVLRVFHKETAVIETHDPSKIYDLRIDSPWPELQAYADSFDLPSLDDIDHAQVPSIVIFIKALSNWKEQHSGEIPRTYADKKQFRHDYVEKLARNFLAEANFAEASQSVHRALQESKVPGSVTKLFELNKKREQDSATHTVFWTLIQALEVFVKRHGKLPLAGNLPDMASATVNYVRLKDIYQRKAELDREELMLISKQSGAQDTISPQLVSIFCKNAASLFVTEGSSKDFSPELSSNLRQSASFDNQRFAAIHYGLLVLSSARAGQESLEEFTEQVAACSRTEGAQFGPEVLKTLRELLLHDTQHYVNISSIMGAITGQEVLKYVTSQYIPLDNLLIFDGVKSSSFRSKI